MQKKPAPLSNAALLGQTYSSSRQLNIEKNAKHTEKAEPVSHPLGGSQHWKGWMKKSNMAILYPVTWMLSSEATPWEVGYKLFCGICSKCL